MNQTRKRHLDGKGKGGNSWKKHWLVGLALKAQSAKLRHVFGPNGLIIDMHAGDGEGTEEPQLDLFGVAMSNSTAALAVDAGAKHDASVVLCERASNRLQSLRSRFGEAAIYLKNHTQALDLDLDSHPWVIVLNDPNGHGHESNGVDVMRELSMRHRRSDFIVCVNEGSLKRHLGVAKEGDDAKHPNAIQIQAVRQSAQQYEWMLDPINWGDLLEKHHGAASRHLSSNHAYKGRVLLLTNSLARLSPEVFSQW